MGASSGHASLNLRDPPWIAVFFRVRPFLAGGKTTANGWYNSAASRVTIGHGRGDSAPENDAAAI